MVRMIRHLIPPLPALCFWVVVAPGLHATALQMKVQQIGPLIYASMDEDSPDPETFRTALFTENNEGRSGLLRCGLPRCLFVRARNQVVEHAGAGR